MIRGDREPLATRRQRHALSTSRRHRANPASPRPHTKPASRRHRAQPASPRRRANPERPSRHPALANTGALASALLSANALWPLGWGDARRALPSFFAGLIVSELPLQTAAAEALAAAALRGSGTGLSRTLTAASWATRCVIEARARRCPAILDEALAEALGSDYRRHVCHPRPASPSPPGLIATARAHRRFTLGSRDIPYGPAGHRNQLDIWRDGVAPQPAPVLVQVHGGGWVTGDRVGQAHPLLVRMAQLGWVCVSISYRLSPRETWPAQLDDVRRAVGWVKENISRWGGDPTFVAITGGSAGGHLAMLAALDPSCDLQAAVPLYGPPDWTNRAGYRHDLIVRTVSHKVVKRTLQEAPEVYRRASPIDQVHAGAPPFFVLQGTNDNLVSPADQRAFVAALRAISRAPVAYAQLPGAFHAFDLLASTRALAAVAAISDFLGWLWGERG
jgi:acetyl esterase/lipase